MDAFDEQITNFARLNGHSTNGLTPVFILVAGITGSGKSTFVARCTGCLVEIGHDLRSCTNDISIHAVELDGYLVHLIDTPGFNDTNRSDIDTLRTIACLFSQSHSNGVRLHGAIFLHRIADNRMTGSSKRNIEMFKALCGRSAFPFVGIGTTMWPLDERDICMRREEQLSSATDFFGELLQGGAHMYRHADRTGSQMEQAWSARSIISDLIRRNVDPDGLPAQMELQIQRELMQNGVTLGNTTAGRVILREIRAVQEACARELADMRLQYEDALLCRDIASTEQLQDLEADCLRKATAAQQSYRALTASLQEMHQAERQRLLDRIDDAERTWQREVDARKDELRSMQISVDRTRGEAKRSIDTLTRQVSYARDEIERRRLERKIAARSAADAELESECEHELRETEQRYVLTCRDVGLRKEHASTFRKAALSGGVNGLVTGITTGVIGIAVAAAACLVM